MTVQSCTPAEDGVLAKASAENFPVAPFFLPPAVRADVMAVYGFARLVDDIGDGDLPPGRQDEAVLGAEGGTRIEVLDALDRDLDRIYADGDGPRHPLMRDLAGTVRAHGIPADPFKRLIGANRMDQTVHRYADFPALLDYCELSANPVGELVLRLFDVHTPERRRLSDLVCSALQVIEHIQDVAEDLAVGRVYLPQGDLARFGVTEADLALPAAPARVRALIAHETARATDLLRRGEPLVGTVRGRLRVLLAGFVAGGRAQLRAIEASGHDVLAASPKADKKRIAAEAALLLAPSPRRRRPRSTASSAGEPGPRTANHPGR
ncbi:squalene synthase HpnC [Mangrovactinospora gilvigrisea]|uniref:Squalene synthase HpnC n=1 Tax=Mangrovactinospora gilvigrisea TaxID=1428644 RepID=A0A1J7BAV4_9ACTN|nr:squalene synthase HpnC [Mangrovactinospora gilvigrisea]OIV35823.1 squalene synthase HpnC [Mangrovactinospora gilvigrisea]